MVTAVEKTSGGTTLESVTYTYRSFAATKGLVGASCGSPRDGRGVLARSPRHRAAEVWRIGANPGAAARPASQCGEQGRALRPGLGSGLGPWIGARGAPQQSPILRPGQWRLSLRLGSAPIAR